ncbi:hypothetical protein ISG33_04645 [Glaciecola sp. MH2013]|uniref:SGNH/GDSL hydrolase family protein n=1 Tax=Glaciecola sp. MH2013 TaxID=2785524 RepID=UPI00189CFCC2|nr:SGNH/GDSL hydrolase family protein [Glaciecola sp. MH2013]MBF7072686.1 hypothetical protein [Glaciecola sp. MH2013]
MQKQNHQADDAGKNRFAFYAVAIALPFIFLLVIEFALRATGAWNSYPLFIEVNNKETSDSVILQPNPDVIKRFFPRPELAPPVSPDTFLFNTNKAEDTIRIVLMGGSTAAGFPYGRFGSPAGMLQQRLKALYPEQEIEVISVAMASINSYALLDFSDEVINISPDYVLIYAGHNEYLGVMGIGSTFSAFNSHAANLLYLKLKDLALYQAMQSVFYAFSSASDTSGLEQPTPYGAVDHSDSSRTLMARVAKDKDIALNSEIFELGKMQFEKNMQSLLAKFSQAGIPVLLSTLASNEKDQAPFSSENSQNANKLLNPSVPRSTKRLIQQGARLLAEGDRSADLAFAVAKAQASTHPNDALLHYLLARDLDLLRFRAPSHFNSIIKTLTKQPNVYLVDAESTIRDDSSNAIIGKEHMLEHLHPNVRGYFLIADAFLNALIENKLLAAPVTYHAKHLEPEFAWPYQPVLASDVLLAEHKIAILVADYPFVETKQEVLIPTAQDKVETIAVERIRGMQWLEAQQSLLTLYQEQGDWLSAATVAGLLFDSLPNNQIETRKQTARIASQLYLKAKQASLAEYYARRALNLLKTSSGEITNTEVGKRDLANFTLTLAEALFKSGNRDESLQRINALLAQQPNHRRALSIKHMISEQ